MKFAGVLVLSGEATLQFSFLPFMKRGWGGGGGGQLLKKNNWFL